MTPKLPKELSLTLLLIMLPTLILTWASSGLFSIAIIATMFVGLVFDFCVMFYFAFIKDSQSIYTSKENNVLYYYKSFSAQSIESIRKSPIIVYGIATLVVVLFALFGAPYTSISFVLITVGNILLKLSFSKI